MTPEFATPTFTNSHLLSAFNFREAFIVTRNIAKNFRNNSRLVAFFTTFLKIFLKMNPSSLRKYFNRAKTAEHH
jgi:hypothetical protein